MSGEDFKSMLYTRSLEALAQPGEAVGLLAAQVIITLFFFNLITKPATLDSNSSSVLFFFTSVEINISILM